LKLDERKTLNGINLINVAQENFFYKFQEYTLEEEIILFELIKEWSDVETLKFNLEIYRTFTLYSKVKTLVDDYTSCRASPLALQMLFNTTAKTVTLNYAKSISHIKYTFYKIEKHIIYTNKMQMPTGIIKYKSYSNESFYSYQLK